MNELHNILNKHEGNLPEEMLRAYLEGKLSAEQQNEVENWLAEEGMEADALEGLQSLSLGDRKAMVKQVNKNLLNNLPKKKRRRSKAIKDNNWAWLAVVFVLLLCIVAYIVVHFTIAK